MFVYDDCSLTDESDEIHERRVNPGSGVGELLRQDLKWCGLSEGGRHDYGHTHTHARTRAY